MSVREEEEELGGNKRVRGSEKVRTKQMNASELQTKVIML